MSENMDRVDTFGSNEAARSLFGPEGGLAVWVRREELSGRVHINGIVQGDPIQTVSELAALRVCLEGLTERLAEYHGVAPTNFSESIEIAADVIRSKTDSVMRIKKRRDS